MECLHDLFEIFETALCGTARICRATFQKILNPNQDKIFYQLDKIIQILNENTKLLEVLAEKKPCEDDIRSPSCCSLNSDYVLDP